MTVWALRASWEVDFRVGCRTCQLTDEMWCSVVWCQSEGNVPNKFDHFSAELIDMGAAAAVIGQSAVSLSRPPCQVWIARQPLSVTLPDSCILALHNWLESAFDSCLFPISEDAKYVIDAGDEQSIQA